MSLPAITILATGGMIVGSADDAGSAARYRAGAVPIDQLLAVSKLDLGRLANVCTEQVAQIDDKDLTFDVWERPVARTRHWADVERVDDVVITHGTDMLGEAAMLLRLTQQTDTPIVLTVAMRPPTPLSADGPLNLLNAIRLATSPSACEHRVLVTLNQRVYTVCDVQRDHTYAVEAFISPDTEPVGFTFDAQAQSRRAAQRVVTEDILPMLPASQWPWVEMLVSYAQPDARATDASIAAGVKRLVIAATGAGSVHTNLEVALNRANQQDVFVLRSTRTDADAVPAQPDTERWTASGSLNPYKVRMLLILLLSLGRAQAEVASLQQITN